MIKYAIFSGTVSSSEPCEADFERSSFGSNVCYFLNYGNIPVIIFKLFLPFEECTICIRKKLLKLSQ